MTFFKARKVQLTFSKLSPELIKQDLKLSLHPAWLQRLTRSTFNYTISQVINNYSSQITKFLTSTFTKYMVCLQIKIPGQYFYWDDV